MEYRRYFIVGTNADSLYDCMNGTVTGELVRCRDCIHQRKRKDMPYGYCDFFKECEPLGEDFNYCSMGRRKK